MLAILLTLMWSSHQKSENKKRELAHLVRSNRHLKPEKLIVITECK